VVDSEYLFRHCLCTVSPPGSTFPMQEISIYTISSVTNHERERQLEPAESSSLCMSMLLYVAKQTCFCSSTMGSVALW